jgi:hypothetical protein
MKKDVSSQSTWPLGTIIIIITMQQEQAISLQSAYHSQHGSRIRSSDCPTPHDNITNITL